ncbi:UDP-3-O-(3-hydroxymyristoyl)glucosamine N-acyltransferase [Malonomonas rubra]|uniref:UDP-3-O-(3-hydroxymyristoyl)glucosamine N-acyltransferase n=1 Tax=Malonomonas rubra TaxID=57040 RepID=UPI0026EBEC18|nr:UDP-3-O-(3-hydroxymyristoyl)glucosamine N-acyltransferase [Malonomonas rubra]
MPLGAVTLGDLATLVGGEVSGEANISIRGVAPLDRAGAGDISFLANPKYRSQLEQTTAAAVIVHPSLAGAIERPLLLVKNPYLAFARILTHFHPGPCLPQGVLPGAVVDSSAIIDPMATVCAGCVVSAGVRIAAGVVLHPGVQVYPDAEIGADSVIHAGVVIRERCVLGQRVIVQPNAVIGSDGFGFAPDGQRYVKIPQVGRVVIEDDVEIGACTCIDRGTLGDTVIRRGSKIDNLVQIAHNAQIGEDCIFVAQVGISGSTEIGRHCTFGGQSATSGHLKVGDNVTIAARGGVSNNVDANQVMAGFPLMPHREWLKMATTMTHLADMRREMQQMRQRLQTLEQQLVKEND